MFDLKIQGDGYVSCRTLEDIINSMGDIITDELAKRDAEIRKLRSDLESERRLRLGMNRR